MATLTSSLIVKLIDQVTGPARGVEASLRNMGGAAPSFADNMASAQQRVATAIESNNRALGAARGNLVDAVAGYYLLDRTVGSAVRVAGNFEMAMNQVAAVSRANDEQLDAMTQQAKELGRTTIFTASQVADGMNFLAMAGFEANKVMEALPQTLDLAVAGSMGLGEAADIVTNILSGYRMGTDELGRATDVLTGTFTRSNTNLVQLGEAFKYAGPVAASAGMEFEETAAILGMMGNNGFQSTMAGTALRGALVRLLSPTKNVQSLMDELGVSLEDFVDEGSDAENTAAEVQEAIEQIGLQIYDTNGRMLPMVDILRQLESHADDTGTMMKLFGQRAGPAMLGVLGAGTDAIAGLRDELRTLDGETARVAAVQMQGFNGMVRAFKSAVEGIQIAVGTALIPALTQFFEKVTEILVPLVELIERHPELTAAIVGTAAAFVALRIAAAALTFVGLLGKGGALSMLAIGLRGVRAAGTPVAGFFETLAMRNALAAKSLGRTPGLLARISDAGSVLIRSVPGFGLVGKALLGVGGALGGISAPIWGGIAVAVGLVAAAGALLWKYWDRITAVLGGVARRIGEELAPAFEMIGPILEPVGELVSGIGDAFGWAGEKISEFMGWIGSFFEREVLSEEQKAEWGDAGYDVADRFINAVKDAIRGMIDWFIGLPGMIIEAIGSIDVGSLIRWPEPPGWLSWLWGGGGQNIEAPSAPAGSNLSGHRKSGGPVHRGGSFLVGEDEPEIFTPSTGGRITPVSQLGGGGMRVGQIGPFHITSSDPVQAGREAARQVEEAMRRLMRGSHADMGARS